jgi:intracellular septation protein
MNKAKKLPYFLLSFIPAVGYWVLETYFSLTIALVGGIILAVLEMIVEKIFTDKIHTISKLNMFLVIFLGLISLWAQEGIWFKLQPTLTGVTLFVFLIFLKVRNKSIMLDMMREMNTEIPLPESFYLTLEWHLAIFVFVFALFMAYISIYQPTSVWIFWKTAGFYIAFFVFLLGEFVYLRSQNQRRRK